MPSSTSSSDRPSAPIRATLGLAAGGFPVALFIALLAYAVTDRLVWSYEPWLKFCARYAPPYNTRDYPMRTTARIRLLPAQESQPPILLLGSSQVFLGLDCAPFERRFPGRTCENLGVAAGSPLDMLFLLNLADQRVKRRVTVMAFFPSTLHKAPKAPFTDTTTLRLLARGGALAHMWPREWVGVLNGLLENSSETLRMSASMQAMWSFVGGDLRAALRYELLPPQLPELLPVPVEELQERMGRVHDWDAKPGRFTRANELAIEEIISRETRHGNRVIVVDCPTRDGYESVIPPGGPRHYQRLLAELAARSDITLVRRTDLPPFQAEDFRDFAHLLPPGRDKASEALAEILARVGA